MVVLAHNPCTQDAETVVSKFEACKIHIGRPCVKQLNTSPSHKYLAKMNKMRANYVHTLMEISLRLKWF